MVTENICLTKKHTQRFFALRAGGRFLGIALFLAVWHTALPAQDFTLNTQAQVNAFDPGITSITGSLTIEGGDITDLTPLSNLTSVGGTLRLRNLALTSLNGLQNITAVGGMTIALNYVLASLDGLQSLASIGGNVFIFNNGALTSLDGLQSLASIGGNLDVQTNFALTSLNGLQNLASVGGYLFIFNNDALTSLESLQNLTSVGGLFGIRGNDALTSLEGLQNLTSVGGRLAIELNDVLTDCSPICVLLNTPGAIGGTITISDNNTGCDSQQEISPDTDGDGIADCVDPDDDNDGCPDESDAYPLVYSADADCDGVHNDCDLCSGGDDNGPCNATALPPLNTLPSYWLCGNNNQKVKVCHNGNTLCISTAAVAAHLAHGDFLGPCTSCGQNAPPPGGGGNASNSAVLATAAGFELLPNPASSKVTVVLEDVECAATLSVFDALGREIVLQPMEAGIVRFEMELPEGRFSAGKYFVRLTTGTEVLTRVLVVQQ